MSSIRRRAKRFVTSVSSIGMVRQGFTPSAGRIWVRELYRDWSTARFKDFRAIHKAHSVGFTARVFDKLGDDLGTFSQRNYLYLRPLNRRYTWLKNRVVATRQIPNLAQHMPDAVCTLFYNGEGLDIVRLGLWDPDCEQTADGVLEIIKSMETVQISPMRWDRGLGRRIAWTGENFTIDGWNASSWAVLQTIEAMSGHNRSLITRIDESPLYTGKQFGLSDAVIRLFLGKNEEGEVSVVHASLLGEDEWRLWPPSAEEVAGEDIRHGWGARRQRAYLGEQRFNIDSQIDLNSGAFLLNDTSYIVPDWERTVLSIKEMFKAEGARFTFISVDIGLSENDYRVVDLSSYPRYPEDPAFNSVSTRYLEAMKIAKEKAIAEKPKIRLAKQVKRKIKRSRRRVNAFQLRAQGYTGRMARAWVRRSERDQKRVRKHIKSDQELNDLTQKQGFLSSTVRNLGVTSENAEDFISERDYYYAQPLNGKYGKWIRDRVSAREIFKPYAEIFQPSHYHFLWHNEDLQIVPLSEAARDHGTSTMGLVSFLKDNGPAQIASSAYSGQDILSVESDGQDFFVEKLRYSQDEFYKLMRRRVNQQFFVLTEPVITDETMQAKFPGAEIQLRITVANSDGNRPRITEAMLVVQEELDLRQVQKYGRVVVGNTARRGRRMDFESLDEGELVRQARINSEQDLEAAIENSEHVKTENEGIAYGDDLDDAVEEELATEIQGDLQPKITYFLPIDMETGKYSVARAFVGRTLMQFRRHGIPGSQEPEAERFAGTIPKWPELDSLVTEMCQFAPQLEFVEFRLVLTELGPRIVYTSAIPSYAKRFPFSPGTVEFLQDRIDTKRDEQKPFTYRGRRWIHNAKLKIRRTFAETVYPPGLVPYQSVRWIGDVSRDFISRNGVPFKKKLWAYRNGFLSYRLPQYGITSDNRDQFISDFEYRWLRHINKKYKYWLEDKISIKYIASDFNQYFPAYYYYTNLRNGRNIVVPMMDCPPGYTNSFDDILRLVKEVGVVALKPDEGSHGDGFYKLEWKADHFRLNGETVDEHQVLDILRDPDNQYLITEFIQMHPVVAEIYPDAVNTLRVLVFKSDGITPAIGNAYMRIGTSESGFVDNTAAGGMLAEVDIETGYFGNGQVLRNGRVELCPVHPDTGVRIEGVIPAWEEAKQTVLDIASSMPQLEYLGFDIAITPDGIKIPEINRFPDYPRIDKLTPQTMAYLLEKVKQKKRVTGLYRRDAKQTLIKLPGRS